MHIETERLIITEFAPSMAESVHKGSLDEDNRRFVPDEVFETVEEAAETIDFLMRCYESGDGPLVYPALLRDGIYVGYHIAGAYTGRGYATEAVRAFLPVILPQLGLTRMAGICLADNAASIKVMERCGFIKEFEGIGSYQGQERRICRFIYAAEVPKL